MTDNEVTRDMFEKLSVEELAVSLLDLLRIDMEFVQLDSLGDDVFQKYVAAIRLMAKLDPQAVADGFVTLSIENDSEQAMDEEYVQELLSAIKDIGQDQN